MSETALAVRQQGGLIPTNLGDAIKLAELMCKASLVPKHLQDKPADCLLVIEQAQRWGMSPFAVAQSTSVISGKLMFEGKLVAAVLNTRGELAKRLDFRFEGEGDALKCFPFATLRGEEKPREIEEGVELAKVRTSNGMWRSQPHQQLTYAATRIWARRHMPELMLGVYAPEEFAEDPKAPAPTVTASYAPPSGSDAASSTTTSSPEEPPEEESLERVWVNAWNERAETWEPAREEPKHTQGQLEKIHELRKKLGHQLNRKVRDKATGKDSWEVEGKYKAKLLEYFGKAKTDELSQREADRTIDYLERFDEKLQKRVEG